jgi:hypothetical protein
MTYEILIKSVSEIINNDLIYKEGLILEYKLNDELHEKLNEHFYYKTDTKDEINFENTDEFEVELGGVLVRFIKDE